VTRPRVDKADAVQQTVAFSDSVDFRLAEVDAAARLSSPIDVQPTPEAAVDELHPVFAISYAGARPETEVTSLELSISGHGVQMKRGGGDAVVGDVDVLC